MSVRGVFGGQNSDVKLDTGAAGKFTAHAPSHPLRLRALVLVGMCLIWLSSAICLLFRVFSFACMYISLCVFILLTLLSIASGF